MKVKIVNTAAGPERVVLAGTVLVVTDESELAGLDYEMLEPVVKAEEPVVEAQEPAGKRWHGHGDKPARRR
jgi:hypothetical protein